MHRIPDRTQQTTRSSGSGALLLDGSVPGMFTMATSGFVDGDTFPCLIEHANGTEVEETLATYHAGTPPYITRLDIPYRSTTGDKIDFSAGLKTISVVHISTPHGLPFRPASGVSTEMDKGDYEVFVATGAEHAVTLPPIYHRGQRCRVTVDNQVDFGVNEVTVTPVSGTINGAANLVFQAPRMSVEFVAVSATEWQTET